MPATTETQQISVKLASLRNAMSAHKLDAIIIPSNDPHNSEYVAEHWKAREWISGFTGSAGTVVVTSDHAGLWTDSRYFLQAEEQLSGTGFSLHKLNEPGVLNHRAWLGENLSEGDRIAIDGKLLTVSGRTALKNELGKKGIELVTSHDLVAEAWQDRPELPGTMVFSHPVKYAGKSCGLKLSAIQEEMKGAGASHLLLTTLDDIAWTFNLRGSDVDFNPVFYGYALLSASKSRLFLDPNKVPDDVRERLAAAGVEVQPYGNIETALAELSGSSLMLDPGNTSVWLRDAVHADCKVIEGPSIANRMKARKNAAEVEGFRKAMVKDGVALTRLCRWLEAEVPKGEITEADVADKLIEFRSQQEGYVGESFPAIAGFRGNGAIVHYRPEHGKAATLLSEGIFLLDSGGQYFCGTTDITRTISFGTPTTEQKRNYTLVLKGHIALARMKFPAGTGGYQLDTLARMFLWQYGLNYGHGTGHGVGSFLNVHEGPQSIRGSHVGPATNAMEVGMLTSNEPGYYKAGEYGIRIENLVLCVEAEETEYGKFIAFDTLTLFPIDTKLVETGLLDQAERHWLNEYHRKVLKTLAPELEPAERSWLEGKCTAI